MPSRLIPNSPHSPPQRMNRNRNTVISWLSSGITKPVVTDSAVTVSSGVLMKPEDTAASPMMSPATMLTAPPTAFGSRIPASRITSYMSSTPMDSVIREKGAFASASVSSCSRVLFSSSGWCRAMAVYPPGSSSARKNARYLIHRTKAA